MADSRCVLVLGSLDVSLSPPSLSARKKEPTTRATQSLRLISGLISVDRRARPSLPRAPRCVKDRVAGRDAPPPPSLGGRSHRRTMQAGEERRRAREDS